MNMWLLLLPLVVQACDSTVYPATPSVYVSSTALPGDGSECTPYNSLLSALDVVKSTGGKVLLQAPVASFALTAVEVAATVELKGSNHTLVLGSSWSVPVAGSLTLTDMKISADSGLLGAGMSVVGRLVLTRCTVSGFSVPFLHLFGTLTTEFGDFSSNSQTVILAEGLDVGLTLQSSSFTSNTGTKAAILDYQVSALKATSLPRITLTNLQVTLSTLLPAFYLRFALNEAPITRGLLKLAGGSYKTKAEVLVCSIVGLELRVEGGSVTGSSAGMRIISTDSPVTVMNTVFEGVGGKSYIRQSSQCGGCVKYCYYYRRFLHVISAMCVYIRTHWYL